MLLEELIWLKQETLLCLLEKRSELYGSVLALRLICRVTLSVLLKLSVSGS